MAFSTLASTEAKPRRTLLEIIAQILRACHGNTKKTHLMYGCNMSFKQLNGYLGLMLRADLLKTENRGPELLFRISGKGIYYLKAFEDLNTLMK